MVNFDGLCQEEVLLAQCGPFPQFIFQKENADITDQVAQEWINQVDRGIAKSRQSQWIHEHKGMENFNLIGKDMVDFFPGITHLTIRSIESLIAKVGHLALALGKKQSEIVNMWRGIGVRCEIIFQGTGETILKIAEQIPSLFESPHKEIK